MKPLRIAVVDLETTGPHVEQGDRMIQIAAVIYENGQVLHTYSMFLNPEQTISVAIRQLTGIEQAQVDHAPTFDQVAGLWYERLKNCVFIAHNLSFDLTFLQYSFALAGYDDFEPLALDTVQLSKVFFPTAMGFNLSDLSIVLGLKFEDAHNALEDAKLTACLLGAIADKIKELDYQTKWYLQQLLQSLPMNYEILSTQPQSFALQTTLFDPIIVHQDDKIVPISFVNQQKMALLAEKMTYVPHLVASDQGMLLTSDQLKVLLNELTIFKQVVLVVPDEQVEDYLQELKLAQMSVSRYITAKEVIEAEAVFRYLSEIDVPLLNQQESIHLAGIIYWLTQSKNRSIHHLNVEFVKHSQIVNRIQSLQMKRPIEYERIRREYQQARCIVVSMTNWYTNIQTESIFQLRNVTTIITDMAQWIQKGQKLHRLILPFSQIFLLLKQIQEQHPHAKSIQKLMKKCHQLMDYYSTLMSEYIDFEINDYRHYALTATNLNVPLLRSFCEMFVAEASLLKCYIAKSEKRSLYQTCLKTVQAILEMCQNGKFVAHISGQVSLGHIYQLQLELIPTSLPNVLDKSQQWLVWQADDHQLWSEMLKQSADSLIKWNIPSLSIWQSPLNLSLPLSYLTENTKQNSIEVMQFLEDSKYILPNHLVIIVNSRQQVIEWHRLLKENDAIFQNYSIFAQGIHGNLRKIKRRCRETEASIRIIQRDAIDGWVFSGSEEEAWLVPQLPFHSFEAPLIQMLKQVNQVNDEQLFLQIVLPMMIADLQHLVQYAYPANIYLFDERILTKNYAEQVTESLFGKIQITLQEGIQDS